MALLRVQVMAGALMGAQDLHDGRFVRYSVIGAASATNDGKRGIVFVLLVSHRCSGDWPLQ